MKRHPYGLSNRILDAIPYDEWVTASEISSKSGIGSHKLALIISERLLNVDVERRKPTTSERGKFYEYRRIERIKSRTREGALFENERFI